MKSIMKKLMFLLIICLTIVVVLTSCTFSNPEKTIDLFIENLNALDIDGMFSCFEPRKAKQFQALYNLGNGIANFLTGMDIDTKSLAQIIPLFSGIDMGDGSKVYWPSWKTDDYETTIDDDKATINAKIIVTTGNDIQYYNAIFYMVKIDGEWYISDLK